MRRRIRLLLCILLLALPAISCGVVEPLGETPVDVPATVQVVATAAAIGGNHKTK